SPSMHDIPPRLRKIMVIAAIGGFIFIAMGSLASNTQVGLDKIVHTAGYAMLGALCIMGLPPVWYLPAFIGIVIAGIGLEYAQLAVLKGRSMEVADAVANSVGLLAGCLVGFVLRYAWAYLKPEFMNWLHRKRIMQLHEGDILFKENDPSEDAFVLREGSLKIVQGSGPDETEIGTVEPGDVVGEMGLIENIPRSATAIATCPCTVFRVTAAEIIGNTDNPQETPGILIARVLAKRLRQTNEKLKM
ncbi:MAG: cyclic nucleotide-binding domain-containing protein, partial [Verrucomicrobiota bacterium]